MLPTLKSFPFRALTIVLALVVWPRSAGAVLDINDGGPVLRAGNFAMRITNAGIVGNAFFDKGLSNDPSFEYPVNSGQEMLSHAELWVGAQTATGETRVSGGPMLEWRPTLAADDRVRTAWHGRLGGRRLYDDDGDGRVDEDILNGKDDDGDGEIDEDLGFSCQEMMAADYVDDRPEAVYYIYDTGENHRPLGLSVHQEAYAWSAPGYDNIAGLQFTITNHGSTVLRNVYLGLLTNLDSRLRNEVSGHLDDEVVRRTITRTIDEGTYRVAIGGTFVGDARDSLYPDYPCVTNLSRQAIIVHDGRRDTHLPAAAVIGLDHTTDPIGYIVRQAARAPTTVSFRTTLFSNSALPDQGGPPVLDTDRYEALRGRGVQASDEGKGDFVVLISCGPFATLAPGQSVQFAAALVAATSVDSVVTALSNALYLEHGVTLNLLPDSLGPNRNEWNVGETGLNGHEICLEPPPGVTFTIDPHCGTKLADLNNPDGPYSPRVTYTAGHCIWTDADCNICTGNKGNETVQRWLDPGELPPAPTYRTVGTDHGVRIEWNNLPEVVIASGGTSVPGAKFTGYKIYKLADWRNRQSLLPPRANWALMASYSFDTTNSEIPLASITDTTLDFERILYEQKLYPVGRYSILDREALNGFDYAYTVASVSQAQVMINGLLRTVSYESPLVTSFDQRVVPHAEAKSGTSQVWVVPNPFRAKAGWDRPPVLGDPLTKHIDFMGLPRAKCTIKIWTVAGDFVAQIDHDGTNGDGQTPWDLVSRNGQDIESGLYLFTVDSSLGHQIGRFVVIR
jgi:hypothetical protein